VPLEGQLTVSKYWASSSIVVYSGPASDKPEVVKSGSKSHLEWPNERKLTKKPSLCEISTSQQWSGVERLLISEGYGTHLA